jgi:hypothetical protein
MGDQQNKEIKPKPLGYTTGRILGGYDKQIERQVELTEYKWYKHDNSLEKGFIEPYRKDENHLKEYNNGNQMEDW